VEDGLKSRAHLLPPLLHTLTRLARTQPGRLLAVPTTRRCLHASRSAAHAACPALSEPLTPRASLARALTKNAWPERGANAAPSARRPCKRSRPPCRWMATGLGRLPNGRDAVECRSLLRSPKKRILRDRQACCARRTGPIAAHLFAPVRGGERTRDIEDPVSLRSRIPSCHPPAVTDIGPDGRRRRPISQLAPTDREEYSVETILSRVLVPAPAGRANGLSPMTAANAVTCSTLPSGSWTREGETSLLPHLKKLRLPCRGVVPGHRGGRRARLDRGRRGPGSLPRGGRHDGGPSGSRTPCSSRGRSRVGSSHPSSRRAVGSSGSPTACCRSGKPASWPNRFSLMSGSPSTAVRAAAGREPVPVEDTGPFWPAARCGPDLVAGSSTRVGMS